MRNTKEYNIREACFTCTTPYQLIGAISIVLAEKIEADIFIFGTFSNYKEFADRLRELNIFKNVYAVDCSKISFLGSRKSKLSIFLQAFLQVAFPNRYVSDFLNDDIAYTTFYSSSRAHVKMLLQSVLVKRNPKMRIVIFDDGLGSYLEESHVLETSKLRRLTERFCGQENFKAELVSIQLYLKDLARVPLALKKCPISQMPRLDWGDLESKQILKKLFGVNNAQRHSEKIILFDNVRGAKSRINMFKKIDECFEKILGLAGNENVLFKGHPRSVESPNIHFDNIEKQSIPVEILYSEMKDLESKILIAYNSTAVYTPKILFNKEPWVICLHRIVGFPLQENSERLYQMFLSTYSKPEKLLAPDSLEELEGILLVAMNRKS